MDWSVSANCLRRNFCAFLVHLFACQFVDGKVNAAVTDHVLICGVDNGVNTHGGDVVSDDVQRHDSPVPWQNDCCFAATLQQNNCSIKTQFVNMVVCCLVCLIPKQKCLFWAKKEK